MKKRISDREYIPRGEWLGPGEHVRDFRLGIGRYARPPFRYRPPPDIDVVRIRKRLRLTQRHFATCFGFALATLRHWERGDRHPRGAALALLHVIRANPALVRLVLNRVRAGSGRRGASEQL